MKKTAIAGVPLVVLLLAGAGYWLVRPWYLDARERRAMSQARQFTERGDFRNGLLATRQALRFNPANAAACELMANYAEMAGSPLALAWRKRVAELQPSLTNRLLLASCALRFEAPPFGLADEALREIGEAGRSNAAYHVVSSDLAIRLNQLARAEEHLSAASRLEPANLAHQVNLAVLRLQSREPQKAAQARARLEQARSDPRLGLTALRSLIVDSQNRGDLGVAERDATELLAHPHSAFSDRLTRLAILRAKQSAGFTPALRDAQRLAGTNASLSAGLCGWMSRAGMAEEATAWVKSLPAAIQAQPPLRMAVAESHSFRGDWGALQAHVESDGWGDLEFIRLAWLARARERQEDKTGSSLNWRKATRLVSENATSLALLARMAEGWGWKAEAERLLWAILERHPREIWAAPALERLYHASGNTRGLRKVYATLINRGSPDPVLRNNLAMCDLLLKMDLPLAHEYARENHERHPNQPGFASTYAFSLFVQGQPAAALKIMESLPPDDLDKPSMKACYGVILAAVGQTEKAKQRLGEVDERALLPEETALMDDMTGKRQPSKVEP
jgi:predicted Zn-dependent protease